jgi:glucose-1-phosphate thymidylyltransferase
VREIRVKQDDPGTRWIGGAFKMPARVFAQLHELWLQREKRDEYIGTLVNAWLQNGGIAIGVKAGESYMDVGTLAGYHAAINLLAARDAPDADAQVFGNARPEATRKVLAGENLR